MSFIYRLVVTVVCLALGWLITSTNLLSTLRHGFDARYQSSNPQMHYLEMGHHHRRRDSGRRLDASNFAGTSYAQALILNKPILFFTYTPSCAVNGHVAELVNQVAPAYRDRVTLVTLMPSGMSLTVPPEDPINDLMVSCTTPICVVNPQTRFLLAFDASQSSQASDLQFALNDFLVRNAQVSQ